MIPFKYILYCVNFVYYSVFVIFHNKLQCKDSILSEIVHRDAKWYKFIKITLNSVSAYLTK